MHKTSPVTIDKALETLSDAQLQDACRRLGFSPGEDRKPSISSIMSKIFLRFELQFPDVKELLDDQNNWKLYFKKRTFTRSYAEHMKRVFENLPGKLFHKMSLVCPITFARISEPVRFKFCTHISCIDNASWEHIRTTSGHFLRCPECHKKIDKKDFIKDELLPEILAAPESQDVDHVYVRYFPGSNDFAWKLPGDEGSVDLTEDPEDEPIIEVEPVPKRKRGRPAKN